MKKHCSDKNKGLPSVKKNKITFISGGKQYILEFTRVTVLEMGRNGFNPEKFIENPALFLPDLFAGSFLCHHRHVKRKFIDAVYNLICDKDELTDALSRMYAAVLDEVALELESANSAR